MTTPALAKLMWEYDCPNCSGTGMIIGAHFKLCGDCKGNRRFWRRLAYTHAKSYEEALKKLLKKHALDFYGQTTKDGYFLVWKFRDGSSEVIDITKAVVHRLRDWEAKDIYKTKKNHLHLAYVGSELACRICNPVCWQNHGCGKPHECNNPDCPTKITRRRLQ